MLKENIPNSMMYISILTMKEIMGENGIKAVLNHANIPKYIEQIPPNNDKLEVPLSDFSKLFVSILDIFGEKGARPLLYNLGKRSFHVILEENPNLFGLVGLGLKLLSKKKRLEKFFSVASGETNKIFGENQRYTITDEAFEFEIYDCFWCKGLKTEGPICFAEIGWNVEAIKWATGGDEHEVKEVMCRAKGDDICKIVISLNPKED
ncbi:MAG: 4-vinyl reductase [Deltaproteobacteria bacterium]|uniref:4-vinyl reductase n=1 Tax=Candidatus Zymogenus saltonus TaxID=2844893 RepID=A0A9D8KEA9_9DELT|nr:4-vinyl reductase [Candidatus Zymogenus saltonus]